MSQIKITDLSFTYPGSFDPVFEHCSFRIDTDWKLGFTGRNGRGKTTFLRLLMGEYEYTGTITKSVDCDYFPFPVTEPARMTRAVLEELYPALEDWRLLREMAALSLGEALLERPFSSLSPGEQTKLLLALLFTRENRFLLIDEPTNHLDLPGRDLVSRYLNSKRGFILVSHDRAFLELHQRDFVEPNVIYGHALFLSIHHVRVFQKADKRASRVAPRFPFFQKIFF